MEKSKLLQLLRLLETTEIHALRTFVKARSSVQRTFALVVLEAILPNLAENEINKIRIFAKVFGKKTPYNVNLLGRYMHELSLMIEDFIVFEQTKKISYHCDLLKSQFCASRGNINLGTAYFEHAEMGLYSQTLRNIDFYDAQQQHETQRIVLAQMQHKNTFEYTPLLNALQTRFLADTLWQYCKIKSDAVANKTLATDSFLPLILAYITENQTLLLTPILAIYYYLYQTICHYTPENYQILNQLLVENHTQLRQKEVSESYILLENCMVQAVAKGEISYSELLVLYQTGFENGFIFNETGNIFIPRLQNIITTALRADQTTWALQFLNTCYSRIADDAREDVYQINLASIYFQQHNFEAVRKSLTDVKYTTIHYQFMARRLQIKLYYEEDNNILESTLNAFQKYLTTTKKAIVEQYKANNKAFVRAVRRLSELRELPRRSRVTGIKQLEREISSATQLAERPWLLQKLAECS